MQIPKRSLHRDSQSPFPGVSTRPQLFMQLAQVVWQSYMASGSYPSDGVVTVFCCGRSAIKEYTPATTAPATDNQIINTTSRASGEGFLKIFHTCLIHYNGSMVSRGLHINTGKPGKQEKHIPVRVFCQGTWGAWLSGAGPVAGLRT